MRNKFLITHFFSQLWLLSACVGSTAAYTNAEVSWRFHSQWKIDERTRAQLQAIYGPQRVDFDLHGSPIPHGLSPAETKRWKRLYNLCMSDGCTYCDTDEGEGSCERGTCGAGNAYCRPHIGPDGQPVCGQECADYAFTSMLTCNGPSKTPKQ